MPFSQIVYEQLRKIKKAPGRMQTEGSMRLYASRELFSGNALTLISAVEQRAYWTYVPFMFTIIIL